MCVCFGGLEKGRVGLLQKVTKSEGYLDLPRMPSRRAFMVGKTFFMIFPKSAALRA